MTAQMDRKLAQAYIRGQKDIDAFDRREAVAQQREFAIDRELERIKAKRPSEPPTEVLDGEFRELGE